MSDYDEIALHSSINFSGNQISQSPSGSTKRTMYRPLGFTHEPSSDINVLLPSNLASSYIDAGHRCLISLTVSPVGANLTLERHGIKGLFKRLLVQTPSSVISDLDELSNLECTLLSIDSDQSYTGGIGALSQGTTCSNIGMTLTAGSVYKFTFTLCLNPLSMASQYIPLFSREQVELIFTLNAIEDYGLWSADPTSCLVSDFKITADVIKLDPSTQSMAAQSCGDIYRIQTTGIKLAAHAQIPANQLTTTLAITSNENYVSKILVTFRPAGAQGVRTRFNTARVNPSLTSIQFEAGTGNNYPVQPLKCTVNNTTEVLCELMSAFNKLGNDFKASSLNALGDVGQLNVASTQATSPFNRVLTATSGSNAGGTDSGSFCVALKLGGLDDDTGEVYNGISTVGKTCNLHIVSSALTQPMIVDVYTFSNQVLTLDMTTDALWESTA